MDIVENLRRIATNFDTNEQRKNATNIKLQATRQKILDARRKVELSKERRKGLLSESIGQEES